MASAACALALALAAAAAQGAAAATAAACEPAAYYPAAVLSAMQSQSGAALQATLNGVIRNNTVDLGYDNAWAALKVVDAWNGDPSSGQVHEIYANRAWPANDTLGNGNSGTTGWNREHVWPNSRGILDGGPDYADLHNLHVADADVNSARGNLPFDNCESANGCTVPAHVEAASDTGKNGTFFMPPAIHRGDVARTVLYMATRYDGRDANTLKLQVTDCPGATTSYMMGRLTTLLEWHRLDPPSAREQYRNGAVCGIQGNRNPYVDFPELASKVFGPGYVDPVSSCAAAGQVTPTVTPMPTSVSVSPTAPTSTRTPTAPTSAAPTSTPSTPTAATPVPSSLPPATLTPTTAAPTAPAAPGELVEGDVAVIGYNASAKSLALLLLQNMRTGATLSMTDNGFQGNGTGFRTNEGVVTFTASAALPRGTVLFWTATATGWTTNNFFALTTAGDSIVLFSGSNAAKPGRFIYALTYNGAFDAPSAAITGTSTCSLPATLTLNRTALALPKGKAGRYTGPTVGYREDLLASISNASLWTQNDTVVNDLGALPAFTVLVVPTSGPTAAPSSAPSSAPTEFNASAAAQPEPADASTVTVVRVFWLVQVVLILACALLLVVYRRHVVVMTAQPAFLWIILFGAAVSSVSVLLFSVEDAGWSCMGTVWLYGCGSMLMYAGLVCKMAKVGKVFKSVYALSARDARLLSMRRNLLFIAAMMGVEVALLLSWTLVSPMTYNLDLAVTPDGIYVLRGSCYSRHDQPFVFSLAAWHLVVLLYALKIAVQTSHIHSVFSEGKYIRIAIFNGLQLTAIATLVLFFTKEPAISMLMRAGAVALHDVALLVILFGTKLQMIWWGSESEGSQGSELFKKIEGDSQARKIADSSTGFSKPKKGSSHDTEAGSSYQSHHSELSVSISSPPGSPVPKL
jgi:endonuclease I